MTPTVLGLLAAGIWLSGRPVGGPSAAARPAPRGRRGGRPLRLARGTDIGAGLAPARLGVIAGVAAVVAAVAALGPAHGGLVGIVGAPLAAAGTARLARRSRLRPDGRRVATLPLTVDLLAAALRAGQPVDAALGAAAATADARTSAELGQVAGLLRLGADPPDAWQSLLTDPVLGGVARTACRSAQSGIRLAGNLEQLGRELRADTRAAAQARAHRAAVWVMAPLGLCFLPAFVCLGVVPTVIGLAGGAFSGLTSAH